MTVRQAEATPDHARTPRVVVAPDSYKGTLTAQTVAEAIARGLGRSRVVCEICPVADGGEGTSHALISRLGGTILQAQAHDPLGRPIQAGFGLLADGVSAIVEVAAASGLGLLAANERDAWSASSAGTGELVAAAVAAGARTVLIACGGSASTDGGAGAIEAIAAAGGLRGARLALLCDVRTAFEQAAAVFAAQKGADASTIRALSRRLDLFAATLPRDPRRLPMTGCAGGLSGGLWAAFDAQLMPGASWVLDALSFDTLLRGATAVITGEGRLDSQTLHGKLVWEIARRAAGAKVALHAVVGEDALPVQARRELALRSVTVASTAAEIETAAAGLATRILG